MAYLSDYTAGTVTVAANSTTVTGSGTAWQTAGFREGDWFIANGWVNVVASVNSNTSVTLAMPWRGGALSAAPYRMRYMSDGSRASAQARQLIDLLGGSGNLEALAGVVGTADKGVHFTGAGTLATHDLTPFARTLLDDANATAARATLGVTALGLGVQVQSSFAPSSFGYAVGGTAPEEILGRAAPFISVNTGSRGLVIAARGSDLAFRTFGEGGNPTFGVYHTGNILGTVSQSGGVPTGAIVERGSNANGEYVRFADGTQICWHTVTVTQVSSAQLGGSWTRPAAFVGPTSTAMTLPSGGGNYTGVSITDAFNVTMSSGGSPNVWGSSFPANSEIRNISVMEIGRWF